MDIEMRARHAEGQLSDETKRALLLSGLSTRRAERRSNIAQAAALAVFLVVIALLILGVM